MTSAISENAGFKPQEMALADERMTLSWAQLQSVLNRSVNALSKQGAGRERVAVFAPNSAEGALAYLTGLRAGISSIPINFHLTAEEVAYILTDSDAKTLFVGPETAQVGLAAAKLADVPTVIGWRTDPMDGLTAWSDWLTDDDREPPLDMAPAAHLHYTSGTTGRPKGTETPPTMFPPAATVEGLFDAFRTNYRNAGARTPWMIVSPMYHTGPLGSIRQLAGGASLVIASRFDPEQVLELIERYKVQAVLMVPTHFQRLLKLPEVTRRKYDVSSVQSLGHTGAACPRDVKQQMIDWFGPVLTEAYGATEAGTTNMITSEEWLERPGSVGRTVPPFELLVISDEGERLGPNQPGQLYFRDTTGRGIIYHNDAEKTRAAHREPGVFTLGEVGYHDDDGYVFITDRVSDMIVSGGVNIYPAEAEQVLIAHPGVADVAVLGAPDAEMGEAVKALIIPAEPDKPPTASELDRFCRASLAGFKCPRSYDFVDDLGRNAMGKINKRDLRRRYWPTDRTIGG